MKTQMLVGTLAAVTTMAAYANATVVTDDFSSNTLNPMWTLHDALGNYASGGGFVLVPNDGIVRFNDIYTNAYGNLSTPLDASGDARVDAVMRTDNYGAASWGMGTTIYFDANNWVSLQIGTAGGASGWVRQIADNGTVTLTAGNTIADMRSYWLIGGVELTPTQIKFYGSPISPLADQPGQTDIDGIVSLIPEFTMARPVNFVGPATAIIGKGYTNVGAGYSNPYLENNYATLDGPAFSGIDYVRLTTTPVPEPAALGLLALGGLALCGRRSRRQNRGV